MYSFESNKDHVDVQGFVQRIANASTPNFPTPGSQVRVQNRYNRTLPVVLLPWEDERPIVDAPIFAITKDISDVGMALVLPAPLTDGCLACGFWLDSAAYVVGEVRQCVAFGGGFWQIGIEMTKLINTADLIDGARLEQLAAHLDPSQKVTSGDV